MNYLYAVNFAPGFERLVDDILDDAGAETVYCGEAFALVTFSGDFEISALGFAKGIIQVFDWAKDLKDLSLVIPDGFNAPHGRTFCIRSFDSGKPAKMEEVDRASLIREISTKTRLIYSSFEPDVDFVLAKRRDGIAYFGYKLPADVIVKPQRGEIGPDIVNLLLKLGEIKAGATVLDAFSGYGGVSKGAVRCFSPEQVVAVEKNSTLVNRLKSEFGKHNKVRVVASEVVHYLKSTDLQFDLIVADPPWGEYEDYPGDLSRLYIDFLNAAKGRLAVGGRIVIMSSAKDILEHAILDSGVKVYERLNVLISGKKVLVLKLGDK